MESNEQTELIAKLRQTHRWRADDSYWGVGEGRGDGGIEPKGKRTHGHGQQLVTARWRGV